MHCVSCPELPWVVKMTKLSKRKPWKKWEMKTSSWQQQHCELGKCQSRDIIRYYCATSRQLFAPLAAFTETWHLFALKLCLRFTFEFPPDEAGPEFIISLAEKKIIWREKTWSWEVADIRWKVNRTQTWHRKSSPPLSSKVNWEKVLYFWFINALEFKRCGGGISGG